MRGHSEPRGAAVSPASLCSVTVPPLLPPEALQDAHLRARLRAFAVTRDPGTIAPLCDIATETFNSYITFAKGRNGDITRQHTVWRGPWERDGRRRDGGLLQWGRCAAAHGSGYGRDGPTGRLIGDPPNAAPRRTQKLK